MNKIKEFIAKISIFLRDFSMMDFFLDMRIKKLDKEMILKKEMVSYYRARIKIAETTIDIAKNEINELDGKIRELGNKIFDIKKIK